jgi:hypothetical protein
MPRPDGPQWKKPIDAAWEHTVYTSPTTGQQEMVDFGDTSVPRHYHYLPDGTSYLSGTNGLPHCRGGEECPPHTQNVRRRLSLHISEGEM